jgi:hypothetical protein
MYGGHVYVTTEGSRHRNVKLWNREYLPYISLANKEMVFSEGESHDINFPTETIAPVSLFSCIPIYGIHGISYGHNTRKNLGPFAVRFWSALPTRDINYPLSFSTSPLLIKSSYPISLREEMYSPCIWIGSSGNYVLALFSGGEYELCLIHCDQDNGPYSRVLTLPHFLSYQLTDVCSIGLDDHLGKVYLVMMGGALCELSYA